MAQTGAAAAATGAGSAIADEGDGAASHSNTFFFASDGGPEAEAGGLLETASEPWRVYLISSGGITLQLEAQDWATRQTATVRDAVAASVGEKRAAAVAAERRLLTLRAIAAHERALAALVALSATEGAPEAGRLEASARLYSAQADTTVELAAGAEADAAAASAALRAAHSNAWYSAIASQASQFCTQVSSARHWVARACLHDSTDLPLAERQGIALATCKDAQRHELLLVALADAARRIGFDFHLKPLLQRFELPPLAAPLPPRALFHDTGDPPLVRPAAPPAPAPPLAGTKRPRGRPRQLT